MQFLAKIKSDCRGVGAIEYALIASLISVAAVAAFDYMGSRVGAKFEQVDQKI